MSAVKADVIIDVSRAAEITSVKAGRAVEAVLDAVKASLAKRERIELRGFGIFLVKPRKRGIARNPKTGEVVPIPPGWTVRFKPGKDLQNVGHEGLAVVPDLPTDPNAKSL